MIAGRFLREPVRYSARQWSLSSLQSQRRQVATVFGGSGFYRGCAFLAASNFAATAAKRCAVCSTGARIVGFPSSRTLAFLVRHCPACRGSGGEFSVCEIKLHVRDSVPNDARRPGSTGTRPLLYGSGGCAQGGSLGPQST
jgi:hypothetical protein